MAGKVNRENNQSADLVSNPVFSVDFEDPHNMYDAESCRSNSDLTETTKTILRLLKANDSSATFFVLGKLADYYPDLLKLISSAGHEIACHGYEHKSLNDMSAESFAEDLQRACESIIKACGTKPVGYRAPWFSLKTNKEFVYELLENNGFIYSSSIRNVGESLVPVKNPIKEFPYNYSGIFNMSVPVSGGAIFRFLPSGVYRFLFDRIIVQERQTFFYIHPADFGVKYIKPNETGIAKFVKYFNSRKTEQKIAELLGGYKFESFINIINTGRYERR